MADKEKIAAATARMKALKRKLRLEKNLIKKLQGVRVKTSTSRVLEYRKRQNERNEEANLLKLMCRAKKVF